MEILESPIKLSLELLSKKWTYEILELLLTQDARFTDIEHSIPDISGKVLSDRLKELFDLGLLTKVIAKLTPLQFSYRISDLGKQVIPVFVELAVFGSKLYPEQVFDTPPNLNIMREYFSEYYHNDASQLDNY